MLGITIAGALALIQDAEAEKEFLRIERTLEAAKTLRVEATIRVSTRSKEKQSEWTATTTFRLQAEGKGRARADLKAGDGGVSLAFDGERFRITSSSESGEFEPPREPLRRWILGLFRYGANPSLQRPLRHLRLGGPGKARPDDDVHRGLRVYGIRTAGEEGPLKALDYTLPLGSQEMKIRLWYEARNCRLVRRLYTMKTEEVESSGEEKYDVFELDAPLPDDAFDEPARK